MASEARVPQAGDPGRDAPALAALHRRTLRVLVASQMLGGAGLAAGVTVGALLAEDLLGTTGLSGLPAALFTLGAAAAALLVGRRSQRAGRRAGLTAGYAVGAAGGAGVVVAAVTGAVPLLLAAFALYGAGVATNLQARYAGADLAPPEQRARAVSLVLVATTAGAVAGPNLVDATGRLVERVGIPELAGPFALAALAYGLAGAVLAVWLRPDPLLVARARAGAGAAAPAAPAGELAGGAAPAQAGDGAAGAASPPAAGAVPRASAAADPGGAAAAPAAGAARPASSARRTVALAAVALVVTQVVMVAVMTMTPIHMRDHGHGLGATGLVISLHVACMYLPSPLTGALADRHGRRPTIAAGALTLLAAGLLAAAAPADGVALLALALGLLGLGWNLGLVGASALVADATPPATRARTQGSVDLAVALAGAAGGLSSGLVVATASYALLSVAGGLLALAILPLLVRPRPAVA